MTKTDECHLQGRYVPGKIINSINKVHQAGKTTVSFEFYPARTEAGITNQLAVMEEMVWRFHPTFITLTWSSKFKNEDMWLRIGSTAQNLFGVDVLMHLTCHLPVDDIKRILDNARKAGIRNILALRGDPIINDKKGWVPVPGGLSHAVELVELIRAEHGDYFCIAVAGYPEVHSECWEDCDAPSTEAAETDMIHLKAKVDAGADLIITQLFYDTAAYINFTNRAIKAGIKCPIIPGYMPVQSYRGFAKFSQWLKTAVPPGLQDALDEVKDDEGQVREVGVKEAVSALRVILAYQDSQNILKWCGNPSARSLHFYTMNQGWAVSKILEELNLMPREKFSPFVVAGPTQVCNDNVLDEVRPIFWANRVGSYLSRTATWDVNEFGGRWGRSEIPAYGEVDDYYLAWKKPSFNRRDVWGIAASVDHICNVFARFLTNEVPCLPWCESGMAFETSKIVQDLIQLNQHGFLTINSQPRVNGMPSDDPQVGWGGPGGLVYQKAYVEFFCNEEKLRTLLRIIDERHKNLSYHAVNMSGGELTNRPPNSVIALTWGVFPDKEIIQPTIVDAKSFNAWKGEAFSLWLSQWASAYDENKAEEKPAIDLIHKIHDSWWLVNLVDNSFVQSPSFSSSPSGEAIFAPFRDIISDELNKELHSLRAELALVKSERNQLQSVLESSRVAVEAERSQ